MNINKLHNIFFIGIGGIGMSALARYFNEKGVQVSGYDRTPSSLTKNLEEEGMHIHYEDNIDLTDKAAELVVYTPAIPQDHAELNYYREQSYEVVKRSDVLQEITNQLFSITVAGTHGKTTMSSMIAHILRHTGYGCNAFLGGISTNYGTNFWSSEKNVAVIEADEFDRSFLKLSPDIAILSSMDPDHLDIYGTPKDMEDSYIQYTGNIKAGGSLIYKNTVQRADEFKADHKLTYSFKDAVAKSYALNIKTGQGGYVYDAMINGQLIKDIELNIGGLHNIENSIAAITAASLLNIDIEKIKSAVRDFRGVKRRFEYIVRDEKHIYIDDYAHHPAELKALLTSARDLFPSKKLVVMFQPHLYSRTRDLVDDFAKSLSIADELLLLPIYPAREKPIPGIESRIIAEKIEEAKVRLLTKDEALATIKKEAPELLISAGAGDIDRMVEPVKEILNSLT